MPPLPAQKTVVPALPLRLLILGTLFVVLGVSVATLLSGGKGGEFRAALNGANTQEDYSSYLQMMSSMSAQQQLEQMKNTRDMQELYLRMLKEGGTNSSFMMLMQQTLSSLARQGSASRGFSQTGLTLEQMLSSMQLQQGSQANSDYYLRMMQEMLVKMRTSSASSGKSQSARSQGTLSSAGTQGLTSSEQELLMRLLLLMMQQSSQSSQPVSSVISSARATSARSSASALPPKSGGSSAGPLNTYEAYVSSVQSVMLSLNKTVNAAMVSEEQQVIKKLPPVQAALATRLTQELTLMPALRERVHAYITVELPRTALAQTAADYLFASFKLENGRLLVAQKYTTNPDVDPHDWYAPAVAYVQSKGLMKGQGDGLFAPTKILNQAELAVILANAMREQSGGARPAAAQAGQSFSAWPAWGQSAIAELRGRGVDVTFFTASALSPVTRLQMSRAIATTLLKGRQANPGQVKVFLDIAKLSAAVRGPVDIVSSYGIMTGKANGLFDPYGLLSRAEAAKIFGKAIEIKAPILKGAANSSR